MDHLGHRLGPVGGPEPPGPGHETLDLALRSHDADLFLVLAAFGDEYGRLIRERAHDSGSLGVSRQARARELADKYGYVEPHLWTGVGRARSGCGAALVGSTDQFMSTIETYRAMGIRAFIFSGYPHLDECKSFGQRVLPNLKTCSLPHAYGRVPATPPATPLGAGDRNLWSA